VYTGAIMVLFLFVIMLLGAERAGQIQAIRWQIPLAIILGVILLGEAVYIIIIQRGMLPQVTNQLPADFGSPAQVGTELFSGYLLPFEITSVLLLVGMVGAIVLTKAEKK
jgi:NADH-quinone oxidoreductase subunit J